MYGSNQNGEIRPFMHGSNQKVAENTPLCTDFTIQSIHKGVLLTKKILATISEEAAAPEHPAIPSPPQSSQSCLRRLLTQRACVEEMEKRKAGK